MQNKKKETTNIYNIEDYSTKIVDSVVQRINVGKTNNKIKECPYCLSKIDLQMNNNLNKQIYKMHAEKSVNELTKLTMLNQPNIFQHLNVLREKRIVVARKEGNIVFYSIANPKILEAFGMGRFLDRSI